jgi:hypothetical protein
LSKQMKENHSQLISLFHGPLYLKFCGTNFRRFGGKCPSTGQE